MVSFAQAYQKAIRLRALLAIWLALSIFGILSGAFNSGQMTLAQRAILWPLVAAGGVLVGTLLRVFVREVLGQRRFVLEAPLVAALAALVLTPFCISIAYGVGRDWRAVPSWGALAGYIFGVSMALSALRHALAGTLPLPAPLDEEEGGAVLLPQGEAEPEQTPRLLLRLSPAQRAPIIRLQVRNHYVDVVTEAGISSLLMRFADAIAETAGVEGMQVHRSHWVSPRALQAVRRRGGKVLLRTSDGTMVPVSRTYWGIVALMGLPDLDATQPALQPLAEELE